MAVVPNARDKGIELAQKAVQEDNEGNYESALQLYTRAVNHLKLAAKYEKNTSVKQTLEGKLSEYDERAKKIQNYLDEQKVHHSNNSSTTQQAIKKQTKGNGGGKGNADGEDKAESHLRGALQGTILKDKPSVQWDDVVGLEAAKEALQEAVVLPLKAPHLFQSGRLQLWNAILLYGPPGTGKTQLARAVATSRDCTFYSVSSANLMSKWVGEGEKLVKELFAMARETKPSIIFIDEIDSLTSARKEGDNEASSRMKTEFLQQMDGVGNNMDGVLVLGATNLPHTLDSAILRRFQRRVYIPLPDAKARAEMFSVHLKGIPHSLTATDFAALGEQTPNYSGSDIRNVVQDARYVAARELKEATHFKKDAEGNFSPCSPGDPDAEEMTFKELEEKDLLHLLQLRKVSMSDFQKALKRTRPSARLQDIQALEKFTEESGYSGVQ